MGARPLNEIRFPTSSKEFAPAKKSKTPAGCGRLPSAKQPHEISLSRNPNYSCQHWIDQGGTKTPALGSTTDINKTVVTRSSVRKEIEVALQDVPDVDLCRVRVHDRGVNRTSVVRLHQRDLPDGRSPEQVLGHPGLRVDEPHPRGVPGVGKRRHQLQKDERSKQWKKRAENDACFSFCKSRYVLSRYVLYIRRISNILSIKVHENMLHWGTISLF